MSEENNDWIIRTKLLPAGSGDCIVFQYKDKKGVIRNILIDGGEPQNYSIYLSDEIAKIYLTSQIDLLIITHIDSDHIGGILEFIQDQAMEKKVGQYWFNSSSQHNAQLNLISENKLSVRQGIKLEEYLLSVGKWHDFPISSDFNQHDLPDIKMIILSPNKDKLERLNKKWKHEAASLGLLSSRQTDYSESIKSLLKNDKQRYDRSTTNGSSIAFILEVHDRKFLFLGDAHINLINKKLAESGFSETNKLKVDFVKLSHHGSKYNIDTRFVNLIECDKYIVCADGTGLPDKVALARIATRKNVTFIFNNDSVNIKNIFTPEEKEEYNIKCEYVGLDFLNRELIWQI